MTAKNRIPTEKLNWAQLTALIEASNLLNATLDHEEVLRQLMSLVAMGVDADRATLYLLERSGEELRSIVLFEDALREIRLPLGEGIAGYVAQTGECVNVIDAYDDPRFNPGIDKEIGYQTRTLLTVPLRDPQGRISGVVQAINKRESTFTEEDELYLLALAEQASLALESARLHENMIADCRHLKFLYRVSSLLTSDFTIDREEADKPMLRDVLRAVLEEAAQAMQCETSSILLLDQQKQQLVFLTLAQEQEQDFLEIYVPLEGSISGWAIQNQEAVIVNDVQSDPRFFPGVDEKTGYLTRTLLCAPLTIRGKAIGVLEVLNKQGGGWFKESDLELAQAIANHAALAIESAQHADSLRRLEKNQERWDSDEFPDLLTLLRS
jgi:adenylate cyclase